MSTRANIVIILNNEDKGKTLTPDLMKLHRKRVYTEPSFLLDAKFHNTTLNEGTTGLMIYHHSDGYPTGLGNLLLTEYNSYEKALNVTLFGDCSSLHCSRFYNSWRSGEDWSFTQPTQITETDINKIKVQEEYLYIFYKGEWYVNDGDGVKKLANVLK